MKFELTTASKKRFRALLVQLLLDLLDGELDLPDQTAHALEELAQEIRRQNTRVVNEAAKNLVY